MDALGIVVTVLLVALLWVAAVVSAAIRVKAATGCPEATSATGPSDRETEPVARRRARRSVR